MRKARKLILVLLSAALVALACLPSGQASPRVRSSRRAHRSVSRRSRQVVRFLRRAVGSRYEAVARNGVDPVPSGSHAAVGLPALAPPPLACPGAWGLVLGEPAQEFAARSRYLVFRRLLI